MHHIVLTDAGSRSQSDDIYMLVLPRVTRQTVAHCVRSSSGCNWLQCVSQDTCGSQQEVLSFFLSHPVAGRHLVTSVLH